MLIGDQTRFALEIRPDPERAFDIYAHIRIWINGHPIIAEDEVAYLPTFNTRIMNLHRYIMGQGDSLWSPYFDNKTDEEIYQLLIESKHHIDQLEYSKPGTHNPIIGEVDDKVYFKHLVQIDETIDQYTIFIFLKDEMVKFIWSCRDKYNCLEEDLNEIRGGTIPKNEFFQVLTDYLNYIKPYKPS